MESGSKWQKLLMGLFQPISNDEWSIVLQKEFTLLNEYVKVEKEINLMLRNYVVGRPKTLLQNQPIKWELNDDSKRPKQNRSHRQ